MKKMKKNLFIVDPEEDFVNETKDVLYVKGADKGISNLSKVVDAKKDDFDDIDVTQDAHHRFDIGHPMFLIDKDGNHPNPYTQIPIEFIEKGKFKATHPSLQKWCEYYVKKLKENNRYDWMIWPEHCIIGTPGVNIAPELMESLKNWEYKYKCMVNITTKGSNFKTEHYSVFKADVPDPEDKGTLLNTRLLDKLKNTDLLVTSGWASSHCFKYSMSDMTDYFGKDLLDKIVLLIDCMSPVKGFEKEADDFLDKMGKMGCKLMTSDEYIKNY